MQWMSRHVSLPILIGFSLTGVSVALIYLLLKKDETEIKDPRKSQVLTSRPTVLKCLVPRQFVPAVIGRGGSMIKDIQSKTETRIRFEDDNIELPNRTCEIKGTAEGTRLAEAMIQNIIANQPVIETYETYIPQKACGGVIGKAGANILQIQASSSAKVIVDNVRASNDPNADRRVIIKGTAEQIAAALLQIEDKVREVNEAQLQKEASCFVRSPRGKLASRNTATNSSENISQTTETPATEDVAVDGLMEVYVSAMDTPSQFWIQVVGPGITALDKLVAEMTIYYNDEENRDIHKLKNKTVGQIVAAKFSLDDKWYRAEVTSIFHDGYCQVYFVDYGDHDEVGPSCIAELRTDFLSLRLQAIECSLANVKPGDGEWSGEACDKFAELTWLAKWKVITAKVKGYKKRILGCGRVRREGSPIPCVDLYDLNDNADINISQELINAGYAVYEVEPYSMASPTLPLSKRIHDLPTSTPASTPTDSIPPRVCSPETTPIITEIDLTTPKKQPGAIEEVDLVSPVKIETARFVDTEKRMSENGSGDHALNGSTRTPSYPLKMKVDTSSGIAPGGYESDLSQDSDELEMG